VDPLKDIQAEVLAIDNLLKSRSQSIKESSGADRETVDAEIQGDQESEDQKGLKRRDQKATQARPDPAARQENAE
jgi:capsid protein